MGLLKVPKSIDSDEFELADIPISELVVLSGKISSELMSPSRRASIQYSGEYAESEGWQWEIPFTRSGELRFYFYVTGQLREEQDIFC